MDMRTRNTIGIAAMTLLGAVSLIAQQGPAKKGAKLLEKQPAATVAATTDTSKAHGRPAPKGTATAKDAHKGTAPAKPAAKKP